jgi:hypothetical protein
MIVIGDKGVFSCDREGIMRGILFEPRACGCGRMTYFVVNRDGKTRCVDCDAEYQQRQGKCQSSS